MPRDHQLDVLTTEAVEAMEIRIKEFHAWFLQHGGKARDVRIEHFRSFGNGVKTLRDIKEGDEVLFVPIDIIMYVAIARRIQTRKV